jgi:hypothetical protein
MDKKIDILLEAWRKRNILGIFSEDRARAVEATMSRIPQGATIGISGSVTLDQLGIVKRLEQAGYKVFNQYKPGLSRDDNLKVRQDGARADYYLTSANAVSEKGELVFFSGYGNRTAGISFAKNVIVICGLNKVVPDLNQALKRAREYATPLNCKRLDWQGACRIDGICRKDLCLFPDYKRMCCQILIIEAEVVAGRLTVILVNEELGY